MSTVPNAIPEIPMAGMTFHPYKKIGSNKTFKKKKKIKIFRPVFVSPRDDKIEFKTNIKRKKIVPRKITLTYARVILKYSPLAPRIFAKNGEVEIPRIVKIIPAKIENDMACIPKR